MDDLTALAEAGAAALVTAMATDLWQATRARALDLFRRSDRTRRAAVEAQLDGNEALVRAADTPDEVRRTLFAYWTLELAELLRHHPSTRPGLTHLTESVPTPATPWPSTRRTPPETAPPSTRSSR